MKCPNCGHPEMVEKICDETISYGGESVTLRDMRGEFCPMCGEGIWDEASYRRYTESQEQLLRSVSATIRRIRKSLKLTQTELAAIFGLGKVAFSRYERGETRPSRPVVKLLKLLERHPDLLEEMRDTGAVTSGTCDSTRTASH